MDASFSTRYVFGDGKNTSEWLNVFGTGLYVIIQSFKSFKKQNA